ncbi:hypothetical protein NLJ89_g6506 [Agrocybe chaxingu]|uniref:Pectate lyase n=1 Tax=Agrocybe chaxingu TaxID=84603 RepID=A0A9W8JZ40_9AGAR|nr:hypothetical protein NLJ89_g6506 [Agrocybe chaxingu]
MLNSKIGAFFALATLVAANPLERRTATNVFPKPPTTSSLSKPITVKAGQTFTPPTAYTRYDRGSGACNGQSEGGDADAVFLLEEGATLSRVVIGPNQSEGVHCLVIQHNGGGTVIVNSFYVEDFGKLYRSCGNCGTQYTRHVQINDVWAVNGKNLAGINTNYGDTAKIRTTKVSSVSSICDKYTGNNSGKEPTKTGSGPDSQYCLYSTSDITSA